MELSKYISRCRNPKVVKNCRGISVATSCGKCPDCMARKFSKNTQKAIIESMSNKKCYFITCTYNLLNVPTMLLRQKTIDNKTFISCIDVTNRFVNPNKALAYYSDKNPNKLKRNFAKRTLSTYNDEIHRINTSFNNPLFKKFYKKAHERGSNIFKDKPFRWLPYLCKEDLQKFIKRLRFQISSKFNEEVRYFAVGEYSPTHFLPHFHILLYFNEPRIETELKNLVSQCWQYGITDCQPARSNQGCASYVASYTNSFTTLPSFLNGVKISPFSVHSHNFGTLYNENIRDFVYSLKRYSFEPFDVQVNDNILSVSLLSEIASSFFPRCYNYEHQDAHARYQLYTCYSILSKRYNFKRVSDLTRCVLVDYADYYNRVLLGHIDLFPAFRDKSIDNNSYFYKAYEISTKIQCGDNLNDFEMSIYNRLYSVINNSKLFCFNLNSSSLCDKMYNLTHFETRARYLIKMIDDFYYHKKQYELSQQFFNQNLYAQKFNLEGTLQTIPLNDRYQFVDNFYGIFYPVGCSGDYSDVYDSNEYIKAFNFEKDIMYRDKVKHKVLNDANSIFVF